MAIQGSAPYLQGGNNTIQLAGGSKLQAGGNATSILQPAGGIPSAGNLTISNPAAKPVSTVSAQQSQNDAFSKEMAALRAELANKTYAPALNFSEINAKSRASAENAVNPYYTKAINDFVAQQAAQNQQKQTVYDLSIKNLEENLKQTLEGNAVTQARTGEDVAANTAAINTQADQSQTDSGQQFAKDRIAQARDIAKSGLTGGLGAQQSEASQQAHNTEEVRQADKFQKAKDEQELFKSRKFEDIALENKNAQTNKGLKAEGEKFDLDSYIQNQALDLQSKQSTLESERQKAIGENQKQQQSLLVQQFISSIANPAQRQAALQAYGSFL